MKKGRKKKLLRLTATVNGILLFICAAAVLAACALAGGLESQKAAKRWAGDADMDFAQVSCYLPEDKKISLDDVYRFRQDMRDKLHEAALDVGSDLVLTDDCWSTVGSLSVTSDKGTADASVIAVGGDFFGFHPLKLISGSYLKQEDIMKDRVILDRELAWRLFGGYDLQGLTVYIDNNPFVVAGVIDREDDYADKKAYTAGMGMFMSYEAYNALSGDGIACYEAVMPEPVKDFAKGVVNDKFPISSGEVVVNSGRFSYGRLMKLAGSFASRSMQTLGVIYPYWENAARCIEDWCARLVMLATVSAVIPVITAVTIVILFAVKGKEILEDRYIPKIKDSAEEAIRVRRRRRWEKKYGKHAR